VRLDSLPLYLATTAFGLAGPKQARRNSETAQPILYLGGVRSSRVTIFQEISCRPARTGVLHLSSFGAHLCWVGLARKTLCPAHFLNRLASSPLARYHLERSMTAFSQGAAAMSDVTRILSAIEQGDAQAAEQLLPLVYDELRKLAAHKMDREAPGHTLQATALVHEAYVRLVDSEGDQHWNSHAHFFAAAAEAMRRILVENARNKQSLKRGGRQQRVDLDGAVLVDPDGNTDELLAIDEALEKLAGEAPAKADLVKLRYFCGLSIQEAADAMSISRATACRHWAYAKTWLYCELQDQESLPE
jgi:RNA polymerase sigma factor (TIGR02999 family)